MFRVLLRLRKGEQVKYIAHLDLMRAFEHALRRARIPVLYSQGFNPRPKMHMASAIGVGVTSDDEPIVLDLAEHLPAKEVMDRLNRVLPVGMEILGAEEVPEGVKSPLSKLNASEYRITLRCPEDLDVRAVHAGLGELLSSGEVRVVRKRDDTKEVDIRPYILGVDVGECRDGRLVLTTMLQSGSSGGARPQDLVQALADRIQGLDVENIHKLRSLESEVRSRNPEDRVPNPQSRSERR